MHTQLLVLLCTLAAGGSDGDPVLAPQSPSYVALKGRRLARFRKTAGASELGGHVTLEFPGKAMIDTLAPLAPRSRHLVFEERGVVYRVVASDPYLAQARRRLRRRPGASMVVKGRVARIRREKERIPAVLVHRLQVRRAGKGPGRSGSPRSAPRTRLGLPTRDLPGRIRFVSGRRPGRETLMERMNCISARPTGRNSEATPPPEGDGEVRTEVRTRLQETTSVPPGLTEGDFRLGPSGEGS